MELESLIIELDEELLKEYEDTGRVCPVKGCGARFPSDVNLREIHFRNSHNVSEFLEKHGKLRDTDPSNPVFMGPSKKGEAVHPMSSKKQNPPQFD